MSDLPKIQKVALWCRECGAVWHDETNAKEGDECPVCKVIHENELDKARKMVEEADLKEKDSVFTSIFKEEFAEAIVKRLAIKTIVETIEKTLKRKTEG